MAKKEEIIEEEVTEEEPADGPKRVSRITKRRLATPSKEDIGWWAKLLETSVTKIGLMGTLILLAFGCVIWGVSWIGTTILEPWSDSVLAQQELIRKQNIEILQDLVTAQNRQTDILERMEKGAADYQRTITAIQAEILREQTKTADAVERSNEFQKADREEAVKKVLDALKDQHEDKDEEEREDDRGPHRDQFNLKSND